MHLKDELLLYIEGKAKKFDGFHVLIIKTIIYYLDEIDVDLFDNNSKILFENDGIYIKLISKSKEQCNLYLFLGYNNYIDIQIGKGAEFLNNQLIDDDDLLEKLNSVLFDLLHSSISEILVMNNDKILKATYWITYLPRTGLKREKYIVFFRMVLFDFIYKKRSKIFQPWILKVNSDGNEL